MKVNWKEWWKAALIRAIRTFAEAALAYIGTGAVVLGDVNWLAVLSAGAFGSADSGCAYRRTRAAAPTIHPAKRTASFRLRLSPF